MRFGLAPRHISTSSINKSFIPSFINSLILTDMSKKFKRSDFDALIAGYSAMNLLNCCCAIYDRLLPSTNVSKADFKRFIDIFNQYVPFRLKHTTHFPEKNSFSAY